VRDVLSRIYANVGGGALVVDDLRAGIARRFATFNDAPGEIGAGLFPVEQAIFDRHLPAGARVLVVGSGTGRELVALLDRGCVVAGIDPSQRALDICRHHLQQHGRQADLTHGFFEDVTVPGPFDAVVFSYYCYSLIPMAARRVAVLRKAAAMLAPGGRVLLSYELERRPGPWLTTLARWSGTLARSDWRVEAGDLLQREPRGLPGIRYSFEHIFTPQEIAAELDAAGLAAIDHAGSPGYPWLVARSRYDSIPNDQLPTPK
jgi:SAM-dependent methyltransferase